MTHLNIQQGLNISELVNANIIKKLYEVALSVPEPLEGELDAAYMSGRLEVPKSYRSQVLYLAGNINGEPNASGRFPDLRIDVTNSYYIPFADPEVESVLRTNNIGDAIGITETDMLSVNSIGTFFQGNTNIITFNELRYFTNVTSIPENCFKDCTSLTSVILPSTCLTINLGGFRNCSSLTTLNAQNVKTIAGYLSLNGLTMSNLTLPAIETIGQRSLSGSNIGVLDLGPNLSSIGTQAFWDSKYPVFIFRGTTVPSFDTTNSNKFLYNMSNVTIYVPESALNDYQTAWPQMASNMVKIEGSIYDTQS